MVALQSKETNRLAEALRRNSEDGFAVLMGRDTSFAGAVEINENDTALVLDAICAMPTHY